MLIVIPARGGSKGIPGKNIKELGGKPLIQYTIDAARELAEDNSILVSTDSSEIREVVENLGLKVPFLRPPELATDEAGSYDVLIHALEWYEKNNCVPEKVILLQPTSPFRNAIHVQDALDKYDDSIDMVVSVRRSKENPYFTLRQEDKEGFLQKFTETQFIRRQEIPDVWALNGAIYIINTNVLKKRRLEHFTKVQKYVMDEISSLDIDTPLDWEIAKMFSQNLHFLKSLLK